MLKYIKDYKVRHIGPLHLHYALNCHNKHNLKKKWSHKCTYYGLSQVTLRVIQLINIDLLLVQNIYNSSFN